MSTPSYLQDHVRRAAEAVGQDLHTSITLRHHGATVRAASSSTPAARCDQAEARSGLGPCIVAMEQQRAVIVPDIALDAHWDVWRQEALQQGFRSCLAMPAQAGPSVAIALNFYSRASNAWGPEVVGKADDHASGIADAVRLRLDLAAVQRAASQRYAELSDDEVIDHAVGATMECNGCDADAAFALLSSAADHRNVTLRDVAETVLRALDVPLPRRPGTDGLGD